MSNETLPFTKAEVEQSIVDRWQRIVRHFPLHIAVTTPSGEQYSYQQIEERSNQLAHALITRLGTENCPIALLLDHTPQLIISIIGTLKANKAYIVLEPTQPRRQLQMLLETTAAPLIVSTHERQALAEAIATASQEIVILETVAGARTMPNLVIPPDALAALFFTSGTVHQPKGVLYTHRMILHRIWVETETHQLTAEQRISGLRTFNLGAGIRDIFNALLNGGTLCLYSLNQYGLSHLSAWLLNQKITYFHLPILLYREWLDTLAPDDYFPDIQHIFPSGRKTSSDLKRIWPHLAPEARFISTYATTESSLLTQLVMDRHTFPPPTLGGERGGRELLPVGQAIPDKQIILLDKQGQPVEIGQVGEIVVRSRYIASGYWRQPELTLSRFSVADDGSGEITYRTGDIGRWRADGFLELLGRRDSQIKLRGYRVVLGELEDALRALPSIKEAVVTANEERGLLYAYAIAATDPPEPARTIRATLAKRLPDYLLPTHLIYLPHFPLLASGKVNRQALPEPASSRPLLGTAYLPPHNATEKQLVSLWEALLGIKGIGVYDNFFELGGHSLLAMRLMMEIKTQWGKILPMLAFAETPTIAQLALILNPAQESSTERMQSVRSHPSIRLRVGSSTSALPRWRRLKSTFLSTLVPFPVRAKYLAWYSGQSSIQRLRFSEEVDLIRQFYASLEEPHLTEEQMIQQSLMSHLWLKWGVLRLHHTNPAQLERWFTVSGFSDTSSLSTGFKEAIAKQKGVILARSHTLFSQQSLFVLQRHGFNEIASIGLGRAARTLKGNVCSEEEEARNNDSYLMAVRSHLLFQSQQTLVQGGIVSIHPDGHHGSSGEGLTIPFHGRLRTFRTGFAELALNTGAAVIPVFVTSDIRGHFHVKFLPALEVNHAASREEQVRSLVIQYVEQLGDHWAEHPASIPWARMRYHLTLPPSTQSLNTGRADSSRRSFSHKAPKNTQEQKPMLHKLKDYIKARISQTTWFRLQLQSARNSAFEPYVKELDIEGISGRFLLATPQAQEWYDHNPIRKLEYEWVIENVKLEGQKVLDGGAHHGQYSVVFSLAASHQCDLVAVDPLPMNCALTEINLLLNDTSAQIEQCAISDRNGEVHFAKWNGSNGHLNSDGDMLVKARTLDSILPDADVVKLDVEGAEYAIVPSTIDKLDRVHTWIIEIHPHRKPHPDQIVKLLLDRGYEVLYVNPKKNQVEPYQLKTEWHIASTIIARR